MLNRSMSFILCIALNHGQDGLVMFPGLTKRGQDDAILTTNVLMVAKDLQPLKSLKFASHQHCSKML